MRDLFVMRVLFVVVLLAILFCLAAILAGCSSFDQGATMPDRYPAPGANSRDPWAQGVGLIVKNKCANCHTSVRDQFVPLNTPTVIDDIGSRAFFTPENAARLERVRARIQSRANPMPPDFGTPLYADEAAAVVRYVNSILAQVPAPTPTPAP